jgi:hypothetical protein
MKTITAKMVLRSHLFVLVAISYLQLANSEIKYILPSTQAATCPSANNCFILSHVIEKNLP